MVWDRMGEEGKRQFWLGLRLGCSVTRVGACKTHHQALEVHNWDSYSSNYQRDALCGACIMYRLLYQAPSSCTAGCGLSSAAACCCVLASLRLEFVKQSWSSWHLPH
jgi:hypothetical protein